MIEKKLKIRIFIISLTFCSFFLCAWPSWNNDLEKQNENLKEEIENKNTVIEEVKNDKEKAQQAFIETKGQLYLSMGVALGVFKIPRI